MPGSDNLTGFKRYFQSIIGRDEDGQNILSTAFTRTTYHHPSLPKVLVIYKGDEKVASKLPHGNAKNEDSKKKPFVKTMPSLLRDMEDKVGDSPSNTYRKMTAAMPRDIKVQAAQSPRNLKQVQNTVHNAGQKLRFTRDSLYNLHVRAMDGNFVEEIITFPDLIVIGWDNNIANVFDSVLQIPQSIGLYYDTTFKLGDFYVSILSFEEKEFTNCPTIPLFFMIHERKTSETHDLFWRHVKKRFPALSSAKNVFIVSDEELAIVNAMQEHFPHIEIYRCWNHVFQNAMFKLRKCGIKKKDELGMYVDDVRHLLSQPNIEKYNELLLIKLVSWSKVFCLF